MPRSDLAGHWPDDPPRSQAATAGVAADPARVSRRATTFLSRLALLLLGNCAIAVAIFLVVEGLSSTVLIVSELLATKPLAERRHTRYDPRLGWVNEPNVFIADMYGPGVGLHTNAQGFRGAAPVSVAVPAGKVRIICSGDSFTFGYGVDDAHTWCQQLTQLNPRFDTVNLGQGGYGVDQAYLWYARDGVRLDHDVQVFAVVTVDFERMLFQHFLGYGKPVLGARDGNLEVFNVPVPQPSGSRLWFNRHARVLAKLRTVRAVQSLLPGTDAAVERARNVQLGDHLQRTVALVLRDLQAKNAAKHSTLVLVYLPTRRDYTGDGSDFWREFLQAEAARQGVMFIDLVSELRQQVRPEQVPQFFIPRGGADYAGAAGHYTAGGNAFVAAALERRLAALPVVTDKLAAAALPAAAVLSDE